MPNNRIDYIEKLTFPHTGSNKKTIVSIARADGKLILAVTNEHEDGTAFELDELKQIYHMLERHKNLFLQSEKVKSGKISLKLDRGTDVNGEPLPAINGMFDADALWSEVSTKKIFTSAQLPVGAHVRLVIDPSFEGRVIKD